MPNAWVDHIGDRLDYPERVPPEYQHLIADDRARVARLLTLPITGRVLDVGCSDGAITKRLRQLPAVTEVLGIDLDRPQIPGYRSHDIRQPMPPVLGIFDTIVATEVFEHLTEADASIALANLRTVLRPPDDLGPSGLLVLSVPNRHPKDLYEAGCRDRWRWPDHRSVWTAATIPPFLGDDAWVTWYHVYPTDERWNGIWLTVTARWDT